MRDLMEIGCLSELVTLDGTSDHISGEELERYRLISLRRPDRKLRVVLAVSPIVQRDEAGTAAAESLPAYYRAMNYTNLVVVRDCGSEFEADLAKGALQAAGIEAMIQADTAGRQRDHLAWSGAGFKLLVREEDAADAHEVLDAPSPE
jgi:hypothetical protein